MKRYCIAPTKSWVTVHELDMQEPAKVNAPYYFLLVDYQDKVECDAIHRFKRTVEKINDESRIEDASLYLTDLYDDADELIFHAVDIIRHGERINVLEENQISVNQRELSLESHVTNKAYTVSLSINDLRVGDIVDYQATTVVHAGAHPLDGKFYYSLFWLSWCCPVLRQIVTVSNQSNTDIKMQLNTLNEGEMCSSNEMIMQNQVFRKEFLDIQADSFDETVPNWLWPDFMLVTTHSEWRNISAYLFDYYRQYGVFDHAIDMNEYIDLDMSDSIEVNLIKIVRFVQNNIRYKGENHGVFSHTPKKPDVTLKNRYGDCKDKSNLLCALLKSLGVSAYLTLVQTGYGKKLNRLNPSPFHFNHMIVCVELNDKKYFFDATIKKQAGDLDHCTTLNYGYALILSEEGRTLEKMAYDLEKDVFYLKHIFDFSSTKDGENTLSINRTYKRHRADNMRYYFGSKEKGMLKEEYLKYAKDESNLDLTVIKPISILADDEQKNILETEEIYKIISLTDDDDNKDIHLPTNIYHEFPVTVNKNQPVRIDLDGRVQHDLEVRYKKISPNSFGEKKIENDWFEYSDSIKSTDKSIYFSAMAVPRKEYVESSAVEHYVNDVEAMRQRSVNNFAYKSGNFNFIDNLGRNFKVTALSIYFIMLLIYALSKYY